MNNVEKYTDYSEVVFYRKTWFWGLSIIFFTPLAILIGLTGDVYVNKVDEDGHVQLIPKAARFIVSLMFLIIILLRVFGPFLLNNRG